MNTTGQRTLHFIQSARLVTKWIPVSSEGITVVWTVTTSATYGPHSRDISAHEMKGVKYRKFGHVAQNWLCPSLGASRVVENVFG